LKTFSEETGLSVQEVFDLATQEWVADAEFYGNLKDKFAANKNFGQRKLPKEQQLQCWSELQQKL